jgi:hypothetical protein
MQSGRLQRGNGRGNPGCPCAIVRFMFSGVKPRREPETCPSVGQLLTVQCMWQLDFHLKITDIITSLSVLCAAATLTYSWLKDRKLRTREYSDKIRSACALTLSKVDRCQILFMSIDDLMQPVITEADSFMITGKNKADCRDLFWKRLNEIRTIIFDRFQKEEIELAYAPLLVYRQDVYEMFRQGIGASRSVERTWFWILQERCQFAILSMQESQMTSAILGNELRTILGVHMDEFDAHLTSALSELKDFLRQIIAMSDREITQGSEASRGTRAQRAALASRRTSSAGLSSRRPT